MHGDAWMYMHGCMKTHGMGFHLNIETSDVPSLERGIPVGCCIPTFFICVGEATCLISSERWVSLLHVNKVGTLLYAVDFL